MYLVTGSDTAYATTAAIDLSHPSIPAGTPEALFQTERYSNVAGGTMVYQFPVGSGADYRVDLYFAEIFQTANGAREFTVNIEGTDVLVDYDIHELVGANAGIVESFVTPVGDDFLTITFVDGPLDNVKVSAIEVSTAGPPPVDVPPTLGAFADQTVVLGSAVTVPIAATETDGDAVTLSWNSTPDASSFTTFVDGGSGSGSLEFDPVAGDAGSYEITVTATDKDGSDTETFTLVVTDPPTGGTIFARINAGGATVAAIDGGPAWEDDTNPGHPFLANAGSGNTNGFPAVDPGPSVPAYVPGAVVDTERWSNSGMAYDIPAPAGTAVFVRLFLGNDFGGTSTAGTSVFDIPIDGVLVEDNFDLIADFGNEFGRDARVPRRVRRRRRHQLLQRRREPAPQRPRGRHGGLLAGLARRRAAGCRLRHHAGGRQCNRDRDAVEPRLRGR